MTDLDTHQNNNRRIGKRHNENQREWGSGTEGARERNREIRKLKERERENERTESKTVGAAFLKKRYPEIDPTGGV